MNPYFLQKQLKENMTDVDGFLKDLKSWGDSMKKKDQSLKTPSKDNKESSETKKQKMNGAPSKGATDYSAWDKFDAEAECERVDYDEKEESDLTDECDEGLRDKAFLEKEQGNKLVKAKKWGEAIGCYSKAIECYGFDPIFYANRALCYLKLGNHAKAESDCCLSLKLDKTYVKAYQRRAAAREALNRPEEAESDLLRVLELEPHNEESRKRLGDVRKKIKPAVQRPISKFTASRKQTRVDPIRPSSWPDDDVIPVRAVTKPAHLRSKKPLKRIEIEEGGEEVATAVKPRVIEKIPTNTDDFKVVEKVETARGEKIARNVEMTKPRNSNADEFKVVEMAKPRSPNTVEKIARNVEKPRNSNTDDFKVVEKVEMAKPRSPNTVEKIARNVEMAKPRSSNTDDFKVVEKVEMTKPRNSVQFYSAWRRQRALDARYEYLKLIRPEELPDVFKESLDSGVFSEILQVLAEKFTRNGDEIFDYLYFLTEIKRFSAFTMFMTDDDKNYLWKLLDYSKECEKKAKEEVDDLVKKYELHI